MADYDLSSTGGITAPVSASAQALLEVAESIALHRHLPALIRDLKERLPRLVNFTSLWLVLHEPSRDKMRLHVIGTPARLDIDVIERNVEDSPSGLAWQTQQPLIVGDAQKETRFPGAIDLLRRDGVRSFCILPLTTPHRRLGGMGFGSPHVDAYRDADIEFLRYVAGQVAIAVDNALSHQDAQALQHQLERERDRLRLLLDVNNDIVSNLDSRQMLRAVSTNVRRVMYCDYASVALREAGDDTKLRVYARHFSRPEEGQEEEIVIPDSGTISGEVVETGKALLLHGDEFSRFPSQTNPIVTANLKSGCFLPLLSRDRVLGSLNIGKWQDGAFSSEDLEFLRQVANQVGIGIENALNYSEVNQVREKLAEERLYLNEEIRSDHNFEEIIGDSQNLLEMVDDRTFRSDLYYRLNVFPITIPPLRERREDIPLLVRYFAEKYARRMNKRIETIRGDTMQALTRYNWPGNIRELQNFIERAVILSKRTVLEAPLAELERLTEKASPPMVRNLAATDRDQILEALTAANWVFGGPGGAAERLGLKRITLLYRMRRLDISISRPEQ